MFLNNFKVENQILCYFAIQKRIFKTKEGYIMISKHLKKILTINGNFKSSLNTK